MVFFQETFCIEAAESEVVQLYRSPATLPLTPEGFSPISCQAYVCVIKDESGPRVYVAVHGREMKRSLIYTVEPASDASPGLEDPLQQAHLFLQGLGFQLEAVNLKYSAAMRQVILREIPFLLPPDDARRLVQERAANEAEAAFLISQAAAAAEGDNDAPPSERLEASHVREMRLAAGNSAARRLAEETRLDEQAAALRRALAQIEASVNAPETIMAEGKQREIQKSEREQAARRAGELEQTIDQLRQQVDEGRVKRDQLVQAASGAAKRITELEQLLRETERRLAAETAKSGNLSELQADAERRLVEMSAELQNVQAEAASARMEIKRVLQSSSEEKNRSAEMRKKIKAAEKETAALSSALAAAEKKIAVLEERLQLSVEVIEAEKRGRELIAEGNSEANGRIAELEKLLQRAEKKAEASTARARELGQAGEAQERRIADLEAALAQITAESNSATAFAAAQEKIADLEAKLRLLQEQAETELQLRSLAKATTQCSPKLARPLPSTTELSTEETPSEERHVQLQEALRREEERSEFLRLEVERFAAAKYTVEKRLAELEKGVAQPAVFPKGESCGCGLPEQGFSQLRPEPAAHSPVPRRPPRPGAFFQVDWNLTKIPVSSPGDICEIHQSMTMVQLCLEGYPNQPCSAYIVVLRKGDSKEVFVPFRLGASNRILVYVPSRQPDSQTGLAKTMKEAAKFLKTVGIEAERLPLPKNVQHLVRELGQILDFRQLPQNAGNF